MVAFKCSGCGEVVEEEGTPPELSTTEGYTWQAKTKELLARREGEGISFPALSEIF